MGGTNLHGIEFQGVSKRKFFIINKLCFVICSLRGRWRFVPRNTATSGARYPAKGRINRAAPYKSAEGDMYPHGCNTQIKNALTINPRGHPSDKVSKRIQLTSSSHPLPLRNDSSSCAALLPAGVPSCLRMTGKNSCMPFHRVIRITEGVSAAANAVSEEEKLRKLCGVLCECS